MKLKLGIVLFLFVLIISSCNKEQLIEPNEDALCENMLYFDSIEEMSTELEKIMNMTYDERLVWEKSKGFTSIELEAERLYESIDFEQFKSVDEVKSFVEKNSNLLQLVEDENGEYLLSTVLNGNPFRFFANKNILFQINNLICKIYDEGVIGVDQSKYIPGIMDDYLSATQQEDAILVYKNDSKKLEKSTNTESCPIALTEVILYDTRFKMHVSSGSIYIGEIFAQPFIDWAITYYERNWLNIWVKKETNIAYNINIQLRYMRLDGVVRQITEIKANHVGIYTKEIAGGEIYPILINPTFGTILTYYNCWGKKVDSSFKVSLYCNNI